MPPRRDSKTKIDPGQSQGFSGVFEKLIKRKGWEGLTIPGINTYEEDLEFNKPKYIHHVAGVHIAVPSIVDLGKAAQTQLGLAGQPLPTVDGINELGSG